MRQRYLSTTDQTIARLPYQLSSPCFVRPRTRRPGGGISNNPAVSDVDQAAVDWLASHDTVNSASPVPVLDVPHLQEPLDFVRVVWAITRRTAQLRPRL